MNAQEKLRKLAEATKKYHKEERSLSENTSFIEGYAQALIDLETTEKNK